MIQNVEIKSFNLRYESYQMKHKVAEDALLCSILENGIHDPLEGVNINNERILLNGLKGLFRFLCPLCIEFQVAAKTNLAHFFCYEMNFNPIDLVMIIKGIGFVKTVKYLKTFLPDTSDSHMEKWQESNKILVAIGKTINMRVNR